MQTSSFLFICLFVHFNLFLTALNYILSLLQNLLKCTLSSFSVIFGRQGIMIKKEEQQFFFITIDHVSTCTPTQRSDFLVLLTKLLKN